MTIKPTSWQLLCVPLCLAAVASGICEAAPSFPNQSTVCTFNAAREQQRAASAQSFPAPVVQAVLVNGIQVWSAQSPNTTPLLHPGDVITLEGSGFGAGPDIDFSKIMIGNSPVLETDLKMYQQKLDLISQVNYESQRPTARGTRISRAGPTARLSLPFPCMPARGLCNCKFRSVPATLNRC